MSASRGSRPSNRLRERAARDRRQAEGDGRSVGGREEREDRGQEEPRGHQRKINGEGDGGSSDDGASRDCVTR